ncbi:MAG: hypothetical protein LC749_11565 [Actinobacteria bacterium]|nr:hypothetical protein [Actinomycetota bacterium]
MNVRVLGVDHAGNLGGHQAMSRVIMDSVPIVVAMVCQPGVAGSPESETAGVADLGTAAGVLVAGVT